MLVASVTTALPAAPARAAAQAGALDPSFGSGGHTRVDFGGGDTISGLAVDAANRVVMVGSRGSADGTDMAIARLSESGVLDPTFGTGGRLLIDAGRSDRAVDVVFPGDGKLLLAGRSRAPSGADVVTFVRLHEDGSRDTSFGSNGVVVSTITESPRQLLLQSDGRLILLMETSVMAFSSQGTVDPAFGHHGIAQLGFFAAAIVQQPDGSLVVGGRRTNDFWFTRLTSNGQVDRSFGLDGAASITFGRPSVLLDVALQPDGRIVASGYVSVSSFNMDMALVRLDAAGAPDPSWGASGKVTTHIGVGDFPEAISVQRDGKVVTAATIAAAFTGSADIAVVRYLSDGALDPTFGSEGKVVVNLGRLEFADTVVLQPNGRIVVGGYSASSNSFQDADFQALRFLGSADNTPPTVVGVPSREPDANGFYREPVTIEWHTFDDAGPATDPPDTLADREGTAIYESTPSCDGAGNCSTGQVTLTLDLTDPDVRCEPARFGLRQTHAAVTATISDSLSGPLASTVVVAVDTSVVGSHTALVTGHDRAGRSTTVACPYDVFYAFGGFFAPIQNPPSVNYARAGRTVPVKWHLADHAGEAVTEPSSFRRLTSTLCEADHGETAPAVENYSGATGLRSLGDGYWIFNWATPTAYAGECRTLQLELTDGIIHTATFVFA